MFRSVCRSPGPQCAITVGFLLRLNDLASVLFATDELMLKETVSRESADDTLNPGRAKF